MVAKGHEPNANIDFNTSKNKAANLRGKIVTFANIVY